MTEQTTTEETIIQQEVRKEPEAQVPESRPNVYEEAANARGFARLKFPRQPIEVRELPAYTRGEEIFNMVTHIVGGAFGVIVLFACVVVAILHRNWVGVITGFIYGASMITCYTISSVYHGLRTDNPHKERGKKVMQVLDHCDIYFLIAGTYTPIAMGALRTAYPKTAWVSFAVVWAISALGTVFTAIDFHKYAVLSYGCYFVAGWSVLASLYGIWHAYSPAFVWWLLAGGVVYTLGMIFFGLQQKHRYCHSVFHLFIVAGSILQFVPIVWYCM